MKILPQIALLSCMIFFLTGCKNENRTPDYLIWHPQEMLADVRQCQSSQKLPPQRQAYCDAVLKTVAAFMAKVSQQQLAPEEFGLKILNEQMEIGVLKIKISLAREALNKLVKEKASPQDIQKANDEFKNNDVAYQQKSRDVDSMLAVLGMTSPD